MGSTRRSWLAYLLMGTWPRRRTRPTHPSLVRLGSRSPRVVIGEGDKLRGEWAGERLLLVDSRPAFELSFWCGTCQLLFKRLEGSTETMSIEILRDQLNAGLDEVSREVLDAFGQLLQKGSYLPLLVEITPTLVHPADGTDYFAHEQVATWGLNSFWGNPVYPRTPYYRTFSTAVTPDDHLYEFIVPMVPPSWNDAGRVREYAETLGAGTMPTAVAVSTLDVCAPADDEQSTDYYYHWGLTHFLLDGHHKVAAAATAGTALRLLALISVEGSLATEDQVLSVPEIRARQATTR